MDESDPTAPPMLPSPLRDAKGRWLSGVSGNPQGRPAVPWEVRQAAACHTLDAVQLLADVMRSEAMPVSARFIAARELLKVSGVKAAPDQNEAAKNWLADLTDEEFDELLARSKADDAAAGNA